MYDTQGRVSTLTVNVRGLYHEVYDTDGKFSKLQNTANGLYHEVYDTNGKFSKLQNTANGLYHEVYDTNGKFSTLQNTANGLYHEVYDTDGKFSTLQNTAKGLYHEVYDTDGKFSTLQNTANGLYHEVYDTDGKFSTLQNTANGLYHEVYDTDGKFSTLQNTANGLYHEVYDTDGKFSTLQNTANGLYHEVYDTDGKFSTLQNTANGLYHEVYDTDGKFSTLQNTANGLYHEVYDTDGKFSTLQNTANGLYHEVYDTDGKFSTLQNTANGLYHEVYDTDGKFSALQNTANGLYHEVYDTNGKFSTLQNTVNGLYHEVYDTNGKFSTLQNTANGLYHEVYDTNGKFSTLQDTADGLYHEVYDDGTGLKTVVATQAGQLNMVVSGTGSNTKIKPAAIQASIDSATGESKIYLGADHIELDGAVVVQSLDGQQVSAMGFEGDDFTVVGDLTLEDSASFYIGDECYISGSDGANHLLDNLIVSASVDPNTNILTLTPLVGDPITFSKATSLSGNWSGNTLTVTASPQNEKYYVGFSGSASTSRTVLEVVSGGAASKDPLVTGAIVAPIQVNSLNTGGQQPTSVYTKDITFSVSTLLQAGSGTASGSATTYTLSPDASHIGLSSATVTIVREAPYGTEISAVETTTGTVTASGQTSNFSLAGSTYRPTGTSTDIRCINLTLGSNVIGRINGYIDSDIESSKDAESSNTATSLTVTPSSGKYAMKKVVVTIARQAPYGEAITAVEKTSGKVYASGQESNFSLAGSTYRPTGATTDIRCVNLTLGNNVIGRINGYVESDIEASKTAVSSASDMSVTVTPSSGKYAMKSATVTIVREAPYGTAIGAAETKTGTITASGKTSTFTLSTSTYRPTGTATDIKCINLALGSNTIGRINNPYSRTESEYTDYGTTRYNAGWAAAYGKVSLPTTENTTTRFIASGPASTVGEQLTHNYYVTADNSYAYLRYNATNGTVVARASNPGYGNGWAAAHGKVGLPTAENTSTRFVASGPSSTVGEQLTHNYYVTVDNDYAYLRFSSTSGTVVARASNPGWNNGYDTATSRMYFTDPGNTGSYMTVKYPESSDRSTQVSVNFHLVKSGNYIYLVSNQSTSAPAASDAVGRARLQISVAASEVSTNAATFIPQSAGSSVISGRRILLTTGIPSVPSYLNFNLVVCGKTIACTMVFN